jgi:hypothetical protein
MPTISDSNRQPELLVGAERRLTSPSLIGISGKDDPLPLPRRIALKLPPHVSS